MSGSGKTRDRVNTDGAVIEALKPEAEPYRVPDMRIAALALRVAASGEKTWDLAYRVRGVQQVKDGRPWAAMAILVSLEEARARAIELTSAARQGVDLIAKEAERAKPRPAQCLWKSLSSLYLARRVGAVFALRSGRTHAQARSTAIANVPAADVRARSCRLPRSDRIAGHERAAGKART